MSFIAKLSGNHAKLPPKPKLSVIGIAWLGGFITIALLAIASSSLSMSLVLGSFGASCVLVFGFPDAPFSQPRNIIAGHLISSFTGLLFLSVFGLYWWSMAAAVATSIALMMFTRTVHPPAGSNPVIVFLALPSWNFLLFPTLTGALFIVVIAIVYNNVTRDVKYPQYW